MKEDVRANASPETSDTADLLDVPNGQFDKHYASTLGGGRRSLRRGPHEILSSLGMFGGKSYRYDWMGRRCDRPAVAPGCVGRSGRGCDDVGWNRG